MFLIGKITSDPYQTQTLVLDDGSSLQLTIYFRPLQRGWFITELIYGTFKLNGFKISVSPNILRQFKNQLPFGIACFSNAETREPTQQQDFSSSAFSLYILSQAEVTEYEAILAGDVNA